VHVCKHARKITLKEHLSLSIYILHIQRKNQGNRASTYLDTCRFESEAAKLSPFSCHTRVFPFVKISNDKNLLPNIVRVIKSRRMRWAGHVACMEERRGVYRVLVGKPTGKRPPERSRHRWEVY
jgi:hypothetical protein